MSYLKPNTAGVYDIPALNASRQLYIKGIPFETYISQLVIEDQLEQSEIDEIKLLLQYLNTTGLSSEWIVDNQNKNQDLKTLITALETKLANIDTTTLTQSSVLNNDNRNSVLKTRLDTTDASLNTINGKTRYVSSVQGNNTAPRVASDFQVTINDREKRSIYLTTGANFISSINDSTNQATPGNYADNNIYLSSQGGMITSTANLNRLQGTTVEITGPLGMGVQSDTTIKIGQGGSLIEIGSIDTPQLFPETNTRIKIGKRSATRNTEITLAGNILVANARFTELSVSNALTWTNLISLIPTTGLPLWVASAILTSAIPNFVYSDLVSMKGTVTKDGDIETTTGAKVKSLTIYDPDVGVDLLPKVTTYLAKGDISQTCLIGNVRTQTFNGEILLRNNNIVSTNVDWALTGSGDKVNQLKISNNDIELTAGAGALNSQIRISNTTSGPIRFRSGTGTGLQANAHDAMKILGDGASTQVVIAGNDAPSGFDSTTKLLVDHQNLANGIKVTNHQNALITRVNHNNVNTPSLTLQTNFTGTTTKSLYLNASDKLMYAGAEVTPVTGITAGQNITINNNNGNYTINSQGGVNGGSGLIYLLRGPSASVVYTGANLVTQTLVASDVYTSDGQKTIRLTTYSSGVTYNLFNHRGLINVNSNPILKGTYEYVPYVSYNANIVGNIYADLYFYATTGTNGFMDKILYQNPISTGFIQIGQFARTPTWDVSLFQFVFKFTEIQFISINYLGSNLVFRCELVDDAGSVLYTFPTLTRTSAVSGTQLSIQTLIFNAGSEQTITQGFLYTGKKLRFRMTLVSGSSGAYFSQPDAGGINSMAFFVPSGSYTTPLSLNNLNQTPLQFAQPIMNQYELLFSLNEFDLSMFPQGSPYFETRFNFTQPTGTTSNHFIEVFFNDGSLSHIHTALNSSTTTPNLYQVMNVFKISNRSPTGGIGFDMGGATIAQIGTLVDNAGVAYNVKSIVAAAGSNLTISNTGGVVTIGGGGNQQTTLYWSGANNKVTFTLPTAVSLKTNKVKGMFRLRLRGGGSGASINYPLFLMNNTHTYPTTNASSTQYTQYRYQATVNAFPMNNYSDVNLTPAASGGGGMFIYDTFQAAETIATLPGLANTGTDYYLNIHFEVSLAYDIGLDRSRSIVAHGECHLIHREPGGSLGRLEKWNFVREHGAGGTSLTHLGFASYSTFTGGSIYGANVSYEVIPLGTATEQTGAGSN